MLVDFADDQDCNLTLHSRFGMNTLDDWTYPPSDTRWRPHF
jgi:hypothetical protein